MPIGFGNGRGSGRKKGSARGAGKEYGRQERSMRFGINEPQNCICPSCGNIQPHQPGFPCFNIKCPKCKSTMVRQFIASDESKKTD